MVWRGNDVLASQPTGQGTELQVEAGATPGVYRVEIRAGGPSDGRTWLLSNPIYVRAPAEPVEEHAVRIDPKPAAAMSLFDGKSDAGWHLETDPLSKAAVDVANTLDGSELRVRFGLASGSVGGEWAALVWGTPIGSPPVNVADYDRLSFTARAERPMRISVQLRTLDVGRTLRRWQRSVYLDTVNRVQTLSFDDFVPSTGTEPPEPPLAEVTQILFVVDTTNTRAGTSSRFWIKNAALER
jgi:hypothetical protein